MTVIAESNTVLHLETGQTPELFGGTEKFADLSLGNYTDKDATATIPFNGVGIEIYGLKSSQLGIAEVKIDGKSVGELDFYTAGATEKGSLIGRFTGIVRWCSCDDYHCKTRA